MTIGVHLPWRKVHSHRVTTGFRTAGKRLKNDFRYIYPLLTPGNKLHQSSERFYIGYDSYLWIIAFNVRNCWWGRFKRLFILQAWFFMELTMKQTAWQSSRDRIVVSTSRCGRDNPGSNPGHGRLMLVPRSIFLVSATEFSTCNGLHGNISTKTITLLRLTNLERFTKRSCRLWWNRQSRLII